jgi:hypothetical protein
MGDRLDVANVEAVTYRQSAMTPAEALDVARREAQYKWPEGVMPSEHVLAHLPEGWALVDTRAVGQMAGTVVDALVDMLEEDDERLWAWAIR